MIPPQLVGKALDSRDWFPFASVDPGPPYNNSYYVLGPFTRDELVEAVWRIRTLLITYAYSNSLGSFSGSYSLTNNAGVVSFDPPLSESGILAHYAAQIGGIFDLDGIDPITSNDVYVGGSWGIYNWDVGTELFTCWFRIYVGGAQSFNETGGTFTDSTALTATVLGKNIPMFVQVGSPAVTGTIGITADTTSSAYWSWDGHFNTTTGAPL